MRIQVYVSEDLGKWIGTQAEKERRSVSEWVALVLEDRQQGEAALRARVDAPAKVNPKAAKLLAEPSAVERKRQRPVLAPKGDCPHPDLGEKRPTSFGFARDCKVCGEVVKV